MLVSYSFVDFRSVGPVQLPFVDVSSFAFQFVAAIGESVYRIF